MPFKSIALRQRSCYLNLVQVCVYTGTIFLFNTFWSSHRQCSLACQTDPYIKNRYGDDALQTACLKGAVQIYNHLIESLTYSNERIAEAFELLGSTYLDEHFDLRLTITYWRKALQIRSGNNLVKQCNLIPNPAYTNALEFTTQDELNGVANDLDAMRMQSLLISERILGPMHKEMIYRLMYRGLWPSFAFFPFQKWFKYRLIYFILGAAYADGLQYQRCVSRTEQTRSIVRVFIFASSKQIDLWKYAFVLRIRKDSLLHNEAAFAAHALVSAP